MNSSLEVPWPQLYVTCEQQVVTTCDTLSCDSSLND